MQQQLNVLIQDNNPINSRPENNMIIPPIVTQNAPERDQEAQKDIEGEFNISLPSLDDSQIAQKVEQVI